MPLSNTLIKLSMIVDDIMFLETLSMEKKLYGTLRTSKKKRKKNFI